MDGKKGRYRKRACGFVCVVGDVSVWCPPLARGVNGCGKACLCEIGGRLLRIKSNSGRVNEWNGINL